MFKCPRCGYLTKNKSDLKKHFFRKKICPSILEDLTIMKCIETTLFDKHKKSDDSENFTEFFGEKSVKVGEKSVKVGEKQGIFGEKSVKVGEKSVKVGEKSVKSGEKSVKVGENAFVSTQIPKLDEKGAIHAIFKKEKSAQIKNFFPKSWLGEGESNAPDALEGEFSSKNVEKVPFFNDFRDSASDSSEKNRHFFEKNDQNSGIFEDFPPKNEFPKDLSESQKQNLQNFSSYKIGNTNECPNCQKIFKNKKNLNEHIKKNCKKKVIHQNIYKYDINHFGRSLYGEKGSNIYIIKTDFNNINNWNLGLTNSIYNKMREFCSQSLLEPMFYRYYPVNFSGEVEKKFRSYFESYKINKDTYDISLENIINIIEKIIGETDNKIVCIEPEVRIEESDECLICNKSFKSKREIFSHLTTCKKYYQYRLKNFSRNHKTPDEVIEPKEIAPVQNNIELDKDKIIHELQNQIQVLLEKVGNVTYNSTNNNIIVINAFGQENTDYINSNYIHNILKSGPYGCIPKLIKQIHFNPKHKENHNVKIPNKRDKYAMVFDGKQWLFKNKKTTINTMADHAYGIIAEHCSDCENRKLMKFCDDYENEEKNLMKRLAEDMELTILNGQKELGLVE
jgi:uncharacterized C2H2 Zn-finger protein